MPKPIPTITRQIGGSVTGRTLEPFVRPDTAIGQGAQALGQGLQQFSEVMHKKRVREQILDTSVQLEDVKAKSLIELQNKAAKVVDPDKPDTALRQIEGPGFDEEFNNGVSERFEQIRSTLDTSEAISFFTERSNSLRNQLNINLAKERIRVATEKETFKFDQLLRSSEISAATDPDNFLASLDNFESTLNQLQFKDEQKAILFKEGTTRVFNAAINSKIAGTFSFKDLNQLESDLKAGTYDQFLVDGKHRNALIRDIDQRRNGIVTEVKQLRSLEKERKAQQAEQAVDEYLGQIADNKHVRIHDVLKDPRLPPTGANSKDQLVRIIERGADGPKTNPVVLQNAFNRINLPDGDPNKITDEGELNELFYRGGLSKSDLRFLRKEMRGLGTEQGRYVADLKKNFFKTATEKLVKRDPVTGAQDPEGLENYQSFFIYANNRITETVKAGENPTALFNPQNPNSLFSDLQAFVRTPDEIFRSMAQQLRSQTTKRKPNPLQTPRRTGESIQEYRERIGVAVPQVGPQPLPNNEGTP